jgi:hypothetical protein
MQFVPSGYVTLLMAVRELMERRFPPQGDSLSAAELEELRHLHRVSSAPPPPAATARRGEVSGKTTGWDAAWAERVNARRAELKAKLRVYERTVEAARIAAAAALRQALGDGDLPSEIMLASGRLTPVRPEAWRTNAAPPAFEDGRLRWRFGPWQAEVIEGPVMIPQAAFSAWLRPSTKPDVAASPPPALADLPAQWTLIEALAWVAFRDTRIVRDASLETPREATPYFDEVRQARLMAEPGYGRHRLTLEWAYDRAQGSPPPGLSPGAAERDLLARLRSGAITARGRTATDAAPRDMDPGDWRGLALVERRRGGLVAAPERTTGRTWHDVTVARDDVVRLWPPAGEMPQTISGPRPTAATPTPSGAGTAPQRGEIEVAERGPTTRTPEPKLMATRNVLAAWYRLRLETWPKDAPPPTEAADLAAAREHFAAQPRVSREAIRAIRREKAPPNWRKTGPRAPR